MKKADIKIGFLCNNLCKHCVQGDKRVIFGNKSFSQIKDELTEARKSCSEAVFTGGEPTIHKHFLDVVNFARGLGFENIQLQTNARMFAYRDFCERAIKAGVSSFCVALLGPNARIHDFLTCVRGSFKQTTLGISNLKAQGAYVADNTVISKKNYRYLPEIAKLLVSLGVDQFQFAFPHPLGSAAKNFSTIVPPMHKIMPYVKKGLDVGIASGKRVMTEAIPYCLMNDYEEFIAEKIIPDTEVFDADLHIDNYTEMRRSKGKSKGPDCGSCRYDTVCEGPWKEYPERFGWGEFIPVKNNS